jgi:tetratricopeptide (TPR) repeat protein
MLVPFHKPDSDSINFGDVPPAINVLLQKGVAAYRRDFDAADALFREALATAPQELPTYYCLYKIHTYQGNLDDARAIALEGMKVAASQAGWSPDWRDWTPHPGIPEGAARFALYTLKALAFIHLRRDELPQSRIILDALRDLDPTGEVGWPVIASLAEGVAG